MTYEQSLTAAVVALAGAVVFLFKLILDSKRACEEDRKKLWTHIESLEEHIDALLDSSCSRTGCHERIPPSERPARPQRDFFGFNPKPKTTP